MVKFQRCPEIQYVCVFIRSGCDLGQQSLINSQQFVNEITCMWCIDDIEWINVVEIINFPFVGVLFDDVNYSAVYRYN